MNTREFLEALIRKSRTEGDLKAYCRQFYAIFTRLYKRKRLDEHTRVRWFLQGLPRETAIKVMRKHNYDDTDDEVLDFEAMHKTAIKMSDAARVLEKLTVTTSSENRFKHLVEDSQPLVPSFISKADTFTPAVTKPIVGTENVGQLTQMLSGLALALRAQAGQPSTSAVPVNYSRGAFNTAATYPNSIPLGQAGGNVQKGNNDCSFCWKPNHWKRDCNELQTLISNGHVYVNGESSPKICQGKPENAGPPLRLPRGVSQLNGVLSALGLDASAHSSVRASALSVAAGTLGNAANYTYDSEEEEYRPFRVEALSQEEKRRTVWRPVEEKFFESWREKAKREEKFPAAKFARTDNYLPGEINDGDEMMEDVEAKPANKPSLFQGFGGKPESIKPDPKKRMPTRKLADIIKDDAQPNKLMKKILDQPVEGITVKDLLSCFDALQKLFFKRIEEEEKAVKVSNLKVGEMEVPEETETSGFAQRFYAVETPKAIVSLAGKNVKALLDSGAEICMMTLETLNRCGLAMRSDPKLHVISATGDKAFFEGVCENAEVCLGGITVRVPIFVTKNGDHDLILGTPYERKAMLSSRYLIDGSCEATIHSECGTKRVKFQAAAPHHKSNKTVDFIFPQESLN